MTIIAFALMATENEKIIYWPFKKNKKRNYTTLNALKNIIKKSSDNLSNAHIESIKLPSLPFATINSQTIFHFSLSFAVAANQLPLSLVQLNRQLLHESLLFN